MAGTVTKEGESNGGSYLRNVVFLGGIQTDMLLTKRKGYMVEYRGTVGFRVWSIAQRSKTKGNLLSVERIRKRHV